MAPSTRWSRSWWRGWPRPEGLRSVAGGAVDTDALENSLKTSSSEAPPLPVPAPERSEAPGTRQLLTTPS